MFVATALWLRTDSADVFKVALFGCNVLQMSAPQPAQSKGKGEEEVARKRLFRGTRLCSFTAIGAGHACSGGYARHMESYEPKAKRFMQESFHMRFMLVFMP